MSSLNITVGQEAKIAFSLFLEDGITPDVGYLDNEFVKDLTVDGAVSANTVVVTEITGLTGSYEAVFTPDTEGTWFLRIEAPSQQVLTCLVRAEFVVRANPNSGAV